MLCSVAACDNNLNTHSTCQHTVFPDLSLATGCDGQAIKPIILIQCNPLQMLFVAPSCTAAVLKIVSYSSAYNMKKYKVMSL